ncbi:tumor necrosis factor receptor superfamily member 6 [Cyclopterus lumpus]|uniref:tumor necrosis factor receptor superfamily member 6 n=1 Tax=Cyclopterus lumpus TaxID=8103 RepID=UPI00148602F3|nr:tumor necrosis factor receptor superfamily member 6 [Cyclopterus lumpus]
MEYRLHCNATHNAVCGCKANYRCKDQSCEQCVPIPSTTTKSTLPPSTTALTTVGTPQPIRDEVWFLVIITLLCAGITIAVVTKIKPFMFWIKSKHGYRLAEGSPSVPSGSEEVSTPVQEVLGKCEV